MACQGVPACRYAVSDLPTGVGDLINKLQSSITSYEKEQENSTNVFYTDRRYYNRTDNRPDYNRTDYHNSRPSCPDRSYNRHSRLKCFICKKEGCRSWKHTPKERDAEKARYKSKFSDRFNTNSHHFDRRLRQFIIDFEGSDSDNEADLDSAFEALLVHNTDIDGTEITPNGPSDSFFTRLGSLSSQTANTITNNLANRAFIHELTATTPNPPEHIKEEVDGYVTD